MQVILVCTTVDTQAAAEAMARALVDKQLAACVHIEPIQSVYRWQGQVQQAHEFKLSCKTTADLSRQVEAAIQELHSYDLPAIYSLTPSHVHAPFEQWIIDETEVNRHPRA